MIKDVPDGWRVEKISNTVFFQEGPGVRKTQFTEKGVKLLNGGNINNNKINLDTTKIYISEDEAYGKYKHFLIEDGDLLIACSGITVKTFHKKIAFITEKDLPLCLNTSTMRFRTLNNERLDINFFKFFLMTNMFKNQLQRHITGSAQLNFGPSHIKKMFIPLPPLPQQEKIVKVLDITSQLIEKQKELIENYDLFLKSKFIEMFGDPIQNPMGWEVKKLVNVCKNKGEYGSGASAIPYDRCKPRYLRITDILDSGNLSKEKKSPSIIEKKYYMNEGDIVFARSGATVGKTYLHTSDEELLFAGYLIRFIPNQTMLNPTFLFYFTKTNFYNSWILSKQKVVAQPNINAKEYAALKIYIPPIDLQNKFASIVEKIDTIKAKETQKLEYLETLHSSLMDKAFKGEIT